MAQFEVLEETRAGVHRGSRLWKVKIAELEEHWLRESVWLGPGGTGWGTPRRPSG